MTNSAEKIANNPAGRLHAILAEARRLNQANRMRNIWAEVFGIEAQDTAELLVAYADLILLVRDTRQQLNAIEDLDQDLYSRPLKKIEQIFAAANLEAKWGAVRDKFDDSTMTGLEFLAETMSRRRPEKVAVRDEVQELLVAVEDLMTEVIASDLPQQVKSVLLEALEDIRHALRTYKMSGVKGLLRSLERGVGAAWVHRSEFEGFRDKAQVQEFFGVLGRLNQIVALASNTQNLLGPILDDLRVASGG